MWGGRIALGPASASYANLNLKKFSEGEGLGKRGGWAGRGERVGKRAGGRGLDADFSIITD